MRVIFFFLILSITLLCAPFSRAQGTKGAGAQSDTTVTPQDCQSNPDAPGCEQAPRPTPTVPGQQPMPTAVAPPPLLTTGPKTKIEEEKPAVPPEQRKLPPEPPTEFQLMVADSVGKMLPIYGTSLFRQPPSTFAPLVNVPVPADYVIGPGDELYVQIWGGINVELRAAVDRNGAIFIPKVGSIVVAGVHFSQLDAYLRQQIERIYRNFDVAATLGSLRSIDVYFVGGARVPGRYTVSSLSTLVNAIFAAGGPLAAGSMRHIELKRDGKLITDFDLYDLLLKGDKSKDAPLLPGDVIYIPPVGPQIAVAGSVNVPAIYELKDQGTSLADAIALAGGLNTVADGTQVTDERIDERKTRSVTEFSLDRAAEQQVKGGDVIHVMAIVPRFDNAVTLRGNVANPGRYSWHVGMKIRDLIPNKDMLLTRQYWQSQNDLVNGTATQYETPEQRAANRLTRQAQAGTPASQPGLLTQQNGLPATQNGLPATQNGLPATQPGAPTTARQTGANEATLRTEVKLAAPEINWDYAVIQRLDPVDLSTTLIPFSLRKAVLEGDSASDLDLRPSDIVTIFSQHDISVPQERQTMFVRVEGEVHVPGIYRVNHGENLRDILQKAGGLTANAYLYGAQFTRESARVDQQASLDRTANVLEAEIQEKSIANSRSNPENASALAAQSAAQEALVRQLEGIKATGRVVLGLKPRDSAIAAVPAIVLEDSDVVLVPPRSQVVSVVGSVFNQSSFVYRRGATVGYYIHAVGNGNANADFHHVLLVRADGSVLGGSVSEYNWWRKSVKSVAVLPGDTIVIPPKLQAGGLGKAIRDWAAVASQAMVGAAIIATH
jgi:polysaccharide biosynthesis/export protein